jgi:penicillin-binding protein 1A
MLLRIIGYAFGIGAFMLLGLAIAAGVLLQTFNADLPDYESLARYEPPVMTRIHAADGQLVAEYAKERRLYLPIQAVPDLIKAAFLSAEDKNFYEHEGVDLIGVFRAAVVNVRNSGSGKRPVGASTITQQVAKNFLLSSEISYERKFKEALLAMRIEQAYSKDRIFELYLNEIYLGLGSYGIAAAALNYFDKPVNQLTVAEAAYLAALPKAPENYNPYRQEERAVERRNWVVDRMVENGYIRASDGAAAKAEKLTVTTRARGAYLAASEFFAEEVRRNLLELYGSEKLYEGGLSVRATIDPELQSVAREKLHEGLIKFDQARGFRGPVASLDLAAGEWGAALSKVAALSDVPEWRLAVVLEAGDAAATIGLQPTTEPGGALSAKREQGTLPLEEMKWAKSGASRVSSVLKPGDVVYVEALADQPGAWKLRQPPEIQGALVAMDPYTGRVLALVGGFSYAESEFNRATQAQRQPGSAFKPFVLATALEQGIPATSVWPSKKLTVTVPGTKGKEKFIVNNYEDSYLGSASLATATTYSDNAVYVQVGMEAGLKRVARTAEDLGIRTPVSSNPAMTLGGLETGVTALDMAHAYASLASGGIRVSGTLGTAKNGPVGIKKVSMRDDPDDVLDENEPRKDRVIPAAVAAETTRILGSVLTTGTARTANLGAGVPQWGKTGTTENYGDAWFVGSSGSLTVAVWVGYPDRLKPMETEWRGEPVAGGTYPAAIWKQFMLGNIALQKERLEKVCEDEDAKKTERCKEAGLGEVPTTTTPAPAPDTPQTTPEDGGTPDGTVEPETGTPDEGGLAPDTGTPTPDPAPDVPAQETPPQPDPAAPQPEAPVTPGTAPEGGAAPAPDGASAGTAGN